jgi:hypothetical protein
VIQMWCVISPLLPGVRASAHIFIQTNQEFYSLAQTFFCRKTIQTFAKKRKTLYGNLL